MQRWCSKLRAIYSTLQSPAKPQNPYSLTSISRRSLHISPNLINKSPSCSSVLPQFKSLRNALEIPCPSTSPLALSFLQVRHITAKQKERKLKSRKPMTPIVSKVKKIKMKFYSSFKGRFRVMNDGQIRRWKEGKRHNAHLKSKKARRRLRKPGTVPLAYAKVMKKLNFKG
ncbi:OLC1v1031065C1 [Oldenlandia corymbosa var. corymbosa]|uniref:OLC1v1031065C1 n=1 Tax=Oldenlandia corymbosa var. corymbosa TaxID=529605 RepID=A0AAV1CIK4_OLDCO|nr:OLC1v1031065C1 [Oldenlandia corymbosa var. corymbosa]